MSLSEPDNAHTATPPSLPRPTSPIPIPVVMPHLSTQRTHLASPKDSLHSLYSSTYSTSSPNLTSSDRSSGESTGWSEVSSDVDFPLTPGNDTDQALKNLHIGAPPIIELDKTKSNSNGVSTKLLTQDLGVLEGLEDVGRGNNSGTELIQKYCCGGGCCLLNLPPRPTESENFQPIDLPDNKAFKSLELKLGALAADSILDQVIDLPPTTVTLEASPQSGQVKSVDAMQKHPPAFVQPHPPHNVFSAPLYHARELTNPGAEKRTFHFDIDVTDYPEELEGVDFKVGGAVGVCPPNDASAVEEIMDLLGVPRFLRDKSINLKTETGRWPTIWGEDEAHEFTTTRRELLTWCSDIQSYPPTKPLIRLLAEHASDPAEKKILTFLVSAQGQAAFCDLRTGAHISIAQLLHAFPSSHPPLPSLLSILQQLMPRFYSLSNDPYVSSDREGLVDRRLIEIAVTVHESSSWSSPGPRSGVGSGFLERCARRFIAAEAEGGAEHARQTLDLRVPLFRGLMANPLSKEFGVSDGPMMLIGAGVGMAPFRGFILNRLRNANCASKIWLVQGVRDSSLDELYSGELGKFEGEIKRVVQSRRPTENRRRTLSTGMTKSASEADLKLLRMDSQVMDDGSEDGDALKVIEARPAAARRPSQWVDSDASGAKDTKYVQDEVRNQADIVWDVIKAVDGRVFVCGSSKGMGEGVETALRDVAISKGKMSEDGAQRFWEEMKEAGKFVSETW